ncbi:MAG: ABC transporter ATP-binding protein [Endomicrobium sp.]|jgi:ABC-2 type transport system ATP-binding protein|uniref:ABC transporter ATP-binding protein n=1 Tax=Candidatus Endomicrobiellum cubanum TaxID=3242325 RepID=UPI00281E0706|nr:ABC transporter ATP-binding protein [Endomicrobium sp.]
MNNCISISVNDVTKTLSSTKALNNVTVSFEDSLIHSIIGPNGAGKTTLIRILAGLLKTDNGSINYTLGKKKLSTVKDYLGYFPQEPSLYPDLSCQEHLEFFKELYKINNRDFQERCQQLYKATNMAQFKERKAGSLSGGMYKKLGLMCVLLNRPKLLLLDEPTIGVDPLSRRELWDLIYTFAKNNMTIIMSTSYMDEAEQANKIHILNEGSLLASDNPLGIMEKYHINKIEDLF